MRYQVKNCAIVILAAGSSSRMGNPKQLLLYKGKSLIQHSIYEAMQTMHPVIVVVGANRDLIKNELKELDITIAENERWAEGISTSLHCGLTAAKKLTNDVDGIIFMVSDQPFISRLLLDQLLKAQHETGLPIIGGYYKDTFATPVLFHKIFFDELMNLKGDTGAKKLTGKYKHLATFVSFPDGDIDIDTMEDYKALLQKINLDNKA
jgi:molybdenum cofactor cytidylyltransferase